MVTDPQVRELMKLIQSEETLALAAAVSTGFFLPSQVSSKLRLAHRLACLMKALLYSSKVSCSSSWVFMTMGKAFNPWRRKG